MSISVSYVPDLQSASQVALDIGTGNLRRQAQEIARSESQRQEALDESARQADLGLAMRARSEYVQGQQFQAQQAQHAQDRQAQLAAQQQQDQFGLYRDSVQHQYGLENLDAQGQQSWQRQSAMSVDTQANSALRAAREMNLSPEGKKTLADLAARYRDIQKQRTSLRPEAYQSVIGDWFADYEAADISQYDVKEMTPDEQWQRGTITQPDGAVYGLDRSGAWRELKPGYTPSPTGNDREPTPDGGERVWNGHKQEWQSFPGAKPVAEPKTKEVDLGKLRKEAEANIKDEWSSSAPLPTDPGYADYPDAPDYSDEKVLAEMERLQRIEGKAKKKFGGSSGDGGGEQQPGGIPGFPLPAIPQSLPRPQIGPQQPLPPPPGGPMSQVATPVDPAAGVIPPNPHDTTGESVAGNLLAGMDHPEAPDGSHDKPYDTLGMDPSTYKSLPDGTWLLGQDHNLYQKGNHPSEQSANWNGDGSLDNPYHFIGAGKQEDYKQWVDGLPGGSVIVDDKGKRWVK